MNSVDWNGGMERWSGLLEWSTGLDYWSATPTNIQFSLQIVISSTLKRLPLNLPVCNHLASQCTCKCYSFPFNSMLREWQDSEAQYCITQLCIQWSSRWSGVLQAPEPERGSVDSFMVDYIPQRTHKLEYTVKIKWYEPRDDTATRTLDLSIN